MLEIKESDWKVLRRLHPLALERFCERVLDKIDRVSRDDAKSYHARYLQIFRLIEEYNQKMAQMFDSPRRSQAFMMLAQIRSQGLLTEEEFFQPQRTDARCHSNSARRRMKAPYGSTVAFFFERSHRLQISRPLAVCSGLPGLSPQRVAGDGLLLSVRLHPAGILQSAGQSGRASFRLSNEIITL
jgi:hypothetical protein